MNSLQSFKRSGVMDRAFKEIEVRQYHNSSNAFLFQISNQLEEKIKTAMTIFVTISVTLISIMTVYTMQHNRTVCALDKCIIIRLRSTETALSKYGNNILPANSKL